MKWRPMFFLAVFVVSVRPMLADEASASGAELSELLRLSRTLNTSGVVRMNYFQSSKTLDDGVDFISATAQIKALPDLSSTIDAKVELRLTKPSLGEGGDFQARLLEGYVTKHFAKADLRVGRQIVAWGRGDGINPTDNLTPRDYITLLPFEDDQRFGTTAVKLDAYLSKSYTFTFFATPWFEPAKLPLPSGDNDLVVITPRRTIANTEAGLKLDKVGEGFDWSVSYFHGISPLPDLRVRHDSSAKRRSVEARYERIDVFGADFARNFGRFGFRGEIAYVDTNNRASDNPAIKKPSLFFVVGVDRTFFDNLNFNLQYFRRQIRQYRSPDSIPDYFDREVALQSAILNGQRDRISDGLSFRVSNKWLNNTLEAEVFGVINITRRDSFVRPSLTFAFNDRWKATVGGDFYQGARNTQFGGLKANRGGFGEIRYGF